MELMHLRKNTQTYLTIIYKHYKFPSPTWDGRIEHCRRKSTWGKVIFKDSSNYRDQFKHSSITNKNTSDRKEKYKANKLMAR